MSMHSETAGEMPWGWREGAGRRGPRWRPLELLAMVLGFIVFWPIGLAILLLKIWQKRSGYSGDLVSMLQESWEALRAGRWSEAPLMRGFGCGARRGQGNGAGFRGGPGFGGGFRMRPTGNSAFDAWRDAELARLEEERRKLEAAEREFADYIDQLRRARDREEFDRFMHNRNAARGGAGEAGPQSPIDPGPMAG